MEKYLSQQQVKTILDNAPKGADQDKLIQGLVDRGYTLQGLNDQKKESSLSDDGGLSVLGTAKDLGIGVAKELGQTSVNTANMIGQGLQKLGVPEGTFFTPTQDKVDTAKQKLEATNTAQSIGKGVAQVAEFAVPGAAGLKVSKVPGIVNLAARAGTEAIGAGAVTLGQTGNIEDAKEAGVVGAAFPVVGKAASALKSEKNAGRMINSLIKTKLNDLSFGKNPGKVVAEEGIVGNSLEELVDKIVIRKNEIGEEIGAIMSQATKDGKKLSVFEAFKPLDDAIEKAKKAELSNAPLIKKLEDLRTDLTKGKKLEDLTPEEAFNMKQNVAELTKFTGNPSDDKAANAALMKIYGNIKDAINTAVDDKNLAVLNDKYGNLLTAVKAGTKRAEAVQGQNIVSLSGQATGIGAGLITLLSGGTATPVVLATLAGADAQKALATPAVKTRVAKWLASKTEKERKEIFKKAPYLKGLIITNTVEGE